MTDYYIQESKRLKYRKLTIEDSPKWAEFFVVNEGLKYVGINAVSNRQEIAEKWIRSTLKRYENQEYGFLAIEIKDTGEFIGLGGILIWELEGKTEYEVAYSLIPKYWTKGYATEIAETIILYSQKNIEADRFISIIHIENLASIRVAEKNGMKVLFNTEFHGMNVNVYGLEKVRN